VDGLNLLKTIGTHRQPGNIQQGRRANPAVGRKQDGEETLADPTQPGMAGGGVRNTVGVTVRRSLLRNNTRPDDCDTGLAGPDLVLTTAEDGLLKVPRT
jgi:hypothetical protein